MEEYRKYEPIFGSWYITRLIGSGSFGKVFEITRTELGTTFRSALKIIPVPQDSSDIKLRITEGSSKEDLSEYYEETLKEIVNETSVMAKVKGKSNIVSYEDHMIIPHDDGIGYDILIRMELLTPLINRLLNGNLSEDEVVRLGIDMCKALDLCHKKKIIHRDIKPQNIFIDDTGEFKLGDFGIAKTIEKTTGGMSKKGTYKYMAPEVFRGLPYDSTVDIYSLGIVMYTLLNGNRGPFMPLPPEKVTPSKEEEACMRRFSGEPLTAPRNAGAALCGIILKACSFYPEHRFQTAEQMRIALEQYQQYGDQYGGTVFEQNDPGYPTRRDTSTPQHPGDQNNHVQADPVQEPGGGKGRTNKLALLLAAILGVAIVCAGSFGLYKFISGDKDVKQESQSEETAETENAADSSDADSSETSDSTTNAAADNTDTDAGQSEAADASQGYPAYNAYGYHTFYFDNNGGYGDFAPIEVAANTSFAMPSEGPYREGSTFVGWYVERLSDEKWYCKDLFKWIYWDETSAAEGVPYLYEPGIVLLYDDSWEKTGGSGNSNYVFHAVWN